MNSGKNCNNFPIYQICGINDNNQILSDSDYLDISIQINKGHLIPYSHGWVTECVLWVIGEKKKMIVLLITLTVYVIFLHRPTSFSLIFASLSSCSCNFVARSSFFKAIFLAQDVWHGLSFRMVEYLKWESNEMLSHTCLWVPRF